LVFAQFNSSIEGVVTDRSGGVVPNASVTAVNVETNVARKVTSSGDGFYRVVDLGLGTYNVVVEARGFKTAAQKSVHVAASQTARVDVLLDVGSVGEKVTVEAQVPQVETDQGRVSGTIT